MTKQQLFLQMNDLALRGATFCRVTLDVNRSIRKISIQFVENGKTDNTIIHAFRITDLSKIDEKFQTYCRWMKSWMGYQAYKKRKGL